MIHNIMKILCSCPFEEGRISTKNKDPLLIIVLITSVKCFFHAKGNGIDCCFTTEKYRIHMAAKLV